MNDAGTISPSVMSALQTLLAATASEQQRAGSVSKQRTAGPALLTIEEAARRLRVSRMTVDRAIKAGEFPVIRFRGTYRLPAAFIDRLLADAEAGAQVVVEDYATTWIAEHAGSLPAAGVA